MKGSKILSLFCVTMCLMFVLVGCNKPENNKPEGNNTSVNTESNTSDKESETDADSEAKVSMSDWEGSWNNMGAYLDEEALQPAFEELGKKENQSSEEAKSAYVKKRHSDFNAMVIEGDKVKFLDGFEDKEGKEIASNEYEFVETHKVKHGNFDLEWHAFKAKEADAKFKVLLMMPVHGEESLTHFHMRYGDDAEKVLAEEGWFPTFVKPSTTIDQLIEEITE